MKVDDVFAKIDAWVASRQGRDWIEPDFIPHDPAFDPQVIQTIQQVRQELYDFVDLLLSSGYAGSTMLEIGLGRNAGTHRVWREFFGKVITVELSGERIDQAKREFHEPHSFFVCGSSRHPKTVEAVSKIVDKVDVLFIDGDHSYGGVRNDWELYHHFVRPGGIVAWHDSECDVNDMYGVPQLLRELETGLIDDKKHNIKRIVRSKKIGIAYEVVE